MKIDVLGFTYDEETIRVGFDVDITIVLGGCTFENFKL